MNNTDFGDALNHIDGAYVPPLDSAFFDKLAPATGQLLTRVAASKREDVDLAVKAAQKALKQGPWGRCSGAERAKLINKLADLIESNAMRFATVLAHEQGRTPADLMAMDLPMCTDTLRYFAGWADKLEGRTIPTAGFMGKATLNYTRLAPVGVAGLIVPWNAPLMITVWKLAPALAAGCTVVVKTSEDAPVAVGLLGTLLQEAGFPPGVVNIVHGIGPEAGVALTTHKDVQKISFTGSTDVGRLIARDAAANFKKVTLELGGKAAQIVFADADVEAAAMGVAMGLFVNQGQTCAAGSRIFVQRSLVQAFEQRLASMADSIQLVGPDAPPGPPWVQMGSLISERHRQRVQACIQQAMSEGAQTLTKQVDPGQSSGFYLRPTVFTNVTPDMTIAREEVFGPVGVVIPFDTEEEAIALANDSRYALSASLWTRDVSVAHRVAAQLDAGAVAINCWSPLDPRVPWGGGKDSGVGKDLSRKALESYLEEKVVTLAL